jgi:hypothetical protein
MTQQITAEKEAKSRPPYLTMDRQARLVRTGVHRGSIPAVV